MDKAKSQRPHLSIFGRRNYGKSSLINALAGEEIAIVANHPGTTTDPVRKSMEITALGPVIITDTAGIDDKGELGKKRIQATLKEIERADLALLMICNNQFDKQERTLIKRFESMKLPYIIIHHKSDLVPLTNLLRDQLTQEFSVPIFDFSSVTQNRYEELIILIKKNIPNSLFQKKSLIGDLVSYASHVLLITPIDVQAPEGRLILPQVQTIRDALDNDCIITIIKEREIEAWKNSGFPVPDLVITDSQTFLKADSAFGDEIPLTSFSIVLARHQGPFEEFLKGTPAIDLLQEGDKVLMMESCSHHISCDDIGRVKIPRWISNYTGKKLVFEAASGLDNPPSPLEEYSLVVQCGGCMITKRQLINRLANAIEKNIPITNYGMTIAWCLGIYNRAIRPFYQGTQESSIYL